jgi:glucose/arabinose dehydrogenase
MRARFGMDRAGARLGMRRTFLLLAILAAGRAGGAALPGFGVRFVAPTAGFATSVAVDSAGVVYYTTKAGNVVRLDDVGASRVVAHVDTEALGDSGLLGMAFRGDKTAIVHYVTPHQIADVISSIDLDSGAETVIHTFNADIDVPSRGSSPEHHGGNPSVAADGSIFVGIGDYGGFVVAMLPDWNGGKVWRIFPDGSVQQFARGFRNPFDVAWDAANQRLIVPDNGDIADDEINIVHLGDDCGWPRTMGDHGPAIDGTTPPVYTFPSIVAPTGFTALSGRNPLLQRGYLLGGFVTRAIYYIADIDHPAPIALISGETSPVVDVAEGPGGEIYFTTGMAIYRLTVPLRGDCNADGKVDVNDLAALERELADVGGHEAVTNAQNGAFAASWGCDVNGDGLIDRRDVDALIAIVKPRLRAVRTGH